MTDCAVPQVSVMTGVVSHGNDLTIQAVVNSHQRQCVNLSQGRSRVRHRGKSESRSGHQLKGCRRVLRG